MIQSKLVQEDDHNTVVVTRIEKSNYEQFQSAAFQKYQQSVLSYGSKLWIEARSASLQRDPDANSIEITTPDVVAATIRTEMKLVRLRQLRFPYKIVQQFISLFIGIFFKQTIDSANLQTGSPKEDFFLWCIAFLLCIVAFLTINHYEMRAELLR